MIQHLLLQMTVDKSPGAVRRMFAGVAPRYDFLNRLLSCGVDTYWRSRCAGILLDHCRVEGPILDSCTGTGDLAFALRRRCDRPIDAVDFTPEMIDLAIGKRDRLPEGKSHDIQFTVGDALALPFEADRFALATVSFGLRNTADPDLALREMVRVCKPGGLVAVLEFSLPRIPLLAPLYRFYFRRVLPGIGRLFTSDRTGAYSYLPQSVLEFDEGEALLRRLEDAGLERTRMVRMSFAMVTLYWGEVRCPTTPPT